MRANSIPVSTISLFVKLFGLNFYFERDVAGVWTIGYGNTYYPNGTKVKQGDRITQAQADEMFEYIVDTDVRIKIIITPGG